MNQKNVLVLFGGCSPEHDISMASATKVIQHMDSYKIIPVCITREGKWMLYDGKLDNLKNIDWEKFGTPAVLSPDRVNRGLLRIVGDKVKIIPIDAVFPILHGENGEDGSIQGLCQLAGIPYVGCGVMTSAVCMDKAMTKLVAQSLRIPQAEYLIFKDGQLEDLEAVTKSVRYKIGYPCFVKPSNTGSSVGIAKAKNKKELRAALESAMAFSNKIIVERGIVGREFECAILGAGDQIETAGPGEVIPDGEFYDYDAKYLKAGSKTVVQADLPEETAALIRQYSADIFRAVDGRGLARADFFVDEGGRVVFNEINTLPGFTSISLYMMMWEAAGISPTELIGRLIEMAGY
ncbi:MAG: D-alanine--D-alanine ligase [Clostridiales bacterium]|nr:D-alanine--D-alanine ligase [Clostridiales bacterium]